MGKAPDRRPLNERLWAKIEKTDTCWNWTGCNKANGYGYIIAYGKSVRVHRLVYELLVAPIPEGMQIDHLCRTVPA
jgi:hypothetical protein